MLSEAILFYLSSYLLAYIFLKITEYSFPHQFNQDTWIRIYCLFVVIIIHFIWMHCSFQSNSFLKTCHLIHHNKNLRNFIFPILFLTPIYIIFFLNYFHFHNYHIDINEEKTDSEWTKKVNRILAKIMILMFIVTIVFLFLTQRYQKRTIQFIDILSIFEVF